MPIERVLIPIDGSEASNKAVRLSGELAPRQGWKVILLHVLERPPVPDFTFPPDVVAQAMNQLRSYGHQILREAEDVLRAAGVDEISRELIEGSAPETIIQRIEEDCCGMVVLGSTGLGRGKLSSLVFGSVAEQVIRRARIPALVVKADLE